MNILSGVSDFFGLDVGTTSIRVVKLTGSGPIKTLERYASMPVDGNLAVSDAKADQRKLAQVIAQLVKQSGILTRDVAVGVPSSHVFTTVADMEKLSRDELAKTIRYQADSFIPTPLAESKIDWALLGDSPKDPSKAEVLLSSVSNEYVESRLDLLEEVGLNVIAFEPDAFALMRAVVAPDATTPQLVLDVGAKSTDLVVVVNGAPRLTRSIPVGTDAIIRSAIAGLAVDATQATQFVYKFGLSKDKLEGRVYNSIIGVVDNLVAEVEKSIKFFQSRYATLKLERIIVTGGASTLPEFPLYIANKFGMNVEIGNAWRNINFPASQQNELLSISNHFAVACGLAERQT
ncbi:MAG TPA: type IV pilus assembly protein PilM [Candidatus Saccharimonadales bacterium]|nr:type IV pilus assembly protein PilM [Candidatus Saccharimonadales bacterium]